MQRSTNCTSHSLSSALIETQQFARFIFFCLWRTSSCWRQLKFVLFTHSTNSWIQSNSEIGWNDINLWEEVPSAISARLRRRGEKNVQRTAAQRQLWTPLTPGSSVFTVQRTRLHLNVVGLIRRYVLTSNPSDVEQASLGPAPHSVWIELGGGGGLVWKQKSSKNPPGKGFGRSGFLHLVCAWYLCEQTCETSDLFSWRY